MVSYNILFNGGTPYRVDVDNDTLTIFKNSTNSADALHDYFRPITSLLMSVHSYSLYPTLNNPTAYDPSRYVFIENNTLLIYMGNGKYMHIGSKVYTFTTINKEKIQSYYSPIGNSDVPQPYALGEYNTYLLGHGLKAIPNSSWVHTPCMEPYTVYYDNEDIGSSFDMEIIDEHD